MTEQLNPFADLIPVKRTETEVYRGNERTPMLSIGSPARGLFNARASSRIAQIADRRSLGSQRPNRFQIHYSNSALSMVIVPMLMAETDDEDLFEVLWTDRDGRAQVNLMEVLQPRNMMVPRGQVMELPVRIEDLPTLGPCIVVDMRAPVFRTVREEPNVEVAAAKAPGA